MIQDNLIKKCICGETESFELETMHDIKISKCESCGVVHAQLPKWDESRYYQFYETDYHVDYMKVKGVINYQDRYDHDRKVAKLRLTQYQNYIKPDMEGLDIGSSNSAFLHEAISQGVKCTGLEPGSNIGDSSITIRGTLDNTEFQSNSYDFITMHDSIEHMISPDTSLQKVFDIVKPGGVVIVDLPDFFNPSGYHHWKYIEHLWYFTQQQFYNLLTHVGFTVELVDKPIPGKLVFYARKK